MAKGSRIWELDALRGIAILLMVLFHLIFDLEVFFGFQNFDHMSGFWYWEGRVAAILFIILVSVATSLVGTRYSPAEAHRKNARRATRLLGLGLVITLATFILIRENTIWFGILHFLGVSILISIPLARFKKLNLILGTFLLLAYYQVRQVYTTNYFGLIFGILPPTFQTYDHYSLIPWLGFVLYGIAIGNYLYPKNQPILKKGPGPIGKALTLTGKYSLWIYLLHQPLLLGLLWIILA